MRKLPFGFKLLLAAIILHIALIAISILAGLLYSTFVNPGKDAAYYKSHAEITGPWISGIFGSVLAFVIVKRYIMRNANRYLAFAILFPVIYYITDIMLLSFFPVKWSEILPVLLLSNGAKLAAALLSYYLFGRQKK